MDISKFKLNDHQHLSSNGHCLNNLFFNDFDQTLNKIGEEGRSGRFGLEGSKSILTVTSSIFSPFRELETGELGDPSTEDYPTGNFLLLLFFVQKIIHHKLFHNYLTDQESL